MSEPDALPDKATDQRIENLEFKVMDLENALQELHEVVLRQYRDIEQLQRRHDELMHRLQGGAEAAATPSPTDELPPHY